MNRNLLLILALLVVALVGVVAVFEAGDREAAGVAGQAFLDGFAADANAVNRVEFRFADDEAGFAVRRKGDAWGVDERDGYPADFEKLANLVTSLAKAKIVEQKTSNPDNYGQLGVDDPATGGSGTGIRLSGDGFSYDVIVGNPAQQSFQYARAAEAATSYLVDQQFELPVSPDDWLTDAIIDIDADRIRRVTIQHMDGESIIIEKASREDADFSVLDVPADRELSYPAVGSEIAGALAGLTLDEVRQGRAVDPVTTTTFETWDGLRIVASVVSEEEEQWVSFAAEAGTGETDEPQEGIATETDSVNSKLEGWQYRIADYKLNQIVRRWEDILEAEQE